MSRGVSARPVSVVFESRRGGLPENHEAVHIQFCSDPPCLRLFDLLGVQYPGLEIRASRSPQREPVLSRSHVFAWSFEASEEIVALSGAHTLGRVFKERSGACPFGNRAASPEGQGGDGLRGLPGALRISNLEVDHGPLTSLNDYFPLLQWVHRQKTKHRLEVMGQSEYYFQSRQWRTEQTTFRTRYGGWCWDHALAGDLPKCVHSWKYGLGTACAAQVLCKRDIPRFGGRSIHGTSCVEEKALQVQGPS